MPAAAAPPPPVRPFSTCAFASAQAAARAARTPADIRLRKAYHWAAALAGGVAAGGLAFGLNYATDALAFLKFAAAARGVVPGGAAAAARAW